VVCYYQFLHGTGRPVWKKDFEHPDTKSGAKVNFCTYWKETWQFGEEGNSQTIDNPAPQSWAKTQSIQRTPIEWIAANYPYKDRDGGDFLNELKLLQKVINAPAKSHVSYSTESSYLILFANFLDSRCLRLKR
jgi:hypothetical protein